MKRVYYCIFILMAVVAVSFFSLARVSKGGRQLSEGIENAQTEYRLTGKFPNGQVSRLMKEWRDYYRHISFAENTDELNDISKLFTELENSPDEQDFMRQSELIKASLRLLRENETPYWYSLL